jgi:hypothetical protein
MNKDNNYNNKYNNNKNILTIENKNYNIIY